MTSKTPTTSLTTTLGSLYISRTPGTTPGQTVMTKQTTNKTRKALRERSLTPSRNPNYVGLGGGDRFIPNRSEIQFERANSYLSAHSLTQDDSRLNASGSLPTSPGTEWKQKQYRAALNGCHSKSSGDLADMSSDQRILAYRKGSAPLAPVGTYNHQKVLYSAASIDVACSAKKKYIRHIPTEPERILDAPNLRNDFYLNLMDWNSENLVAIALGNTVHLWEHVSGRHQILVDEVLPHTETYISNISWSANAQYLCVGYSDGRIDIFDHERSHEALRTMYNEVDQSVTSSSWLDTTLSCGSNSGKIIHHDVRVHHHEIGSFARHTQSVCGLRWSPDGVQLASGGNDNLVNLWSRTAISQRNCPSTIYTLDDHQAAVKALAFCPWKPKLLATGGGTADRHVKYWNTNDGMLTGDFDLESQINGIIFNEPYQEVITAHGFPHHVLRISKFDKMHYIDTLRGHTSRVLGIVPSPDGQWVLSAGGDESLRLWHCFKVDKSTKGLLSQKKIVSVAMSKPSAFASVMR